MTREEERRYQKEYREKNKEKLMEYRKQWLSDNPESRKAISSKYYKGNKELISEKKKVYNSNNLEKHSIRQKRYYDRYRIDHPVVEKVKKTVLEVSIAKYNTNRKYYYKNKDSIKIKKELWRKNNIQKYRLYSIKRRFLKTNNGVFKVLDKDIFKQKARQNNECFWCGCKLDKINIDHVIPLVKGGAHSVGNIVISCPTCNLIKSDRLPIEFKMYAKRNIIIQ
jgi:5-methylcytosine-specific restriction endonuclease McrA